MPVLDCIVIKHVLKPEMHPFGVKGEIISLYPINIRDHYGENIVEEMLQLFTAGSGDKFEYEKAKIDTSKILYQKYPERVLDYVMLHPDFTDTESVASKPAAS